MGGAVAKMILRRLAPKLKLTAFATAIGPLSITSKDRKSLERARGAYPIDRFVARFPSASQQGEIQTLLVEAKKHGRSYGGIAEIWVDDVPIGLGQPVFHKLKSDLASAFLSVGATSSLEIGSGLASTHAEGSEFHESDDDANVYGGMRGGITTGRRLVIRVGFKPTSSVLDVAKKGRHDPCIVPRALPVLEAMLNLVLADHLLWQRSDRI
jgi:chorismate synthase